MINNLFIQIPGLIFLLVLSKVYFSAERFACEENKIYTKLIFVSLSCLLLDILSVSLIANIGVTSTLSVAATKLYLASVLVWLLIMTAFIYVVSLKKAEKFSLARTSSFMKILMGLIPVGIVCLAAIIVLPIKLIYKANSVYFNGQSADLLYVVSFIFIFIWFIRLLRRKNYIKGTKNSLILSVIIFVLIGTIVQFLYPQYLILTFILYFITFIMYFKIDNPDLKLVEELEKAKKKVEEAEVTTKDTLLKASHEIRTPLNAISGFAQSIIEETSDNVNEDVKNIKESSDKLVHIVDNILDVSNVDMEMYKLIYDDYNVEALMKQIVALAKSKMTSQRVELNIMIDENIPTFLFGDSIRIKEIVLNIVCNAIKYTKDGCINLNVGCITVGNVSRLIVSVKDTGIGITQDKLDKLFDERVTKNRELMDGISEINLATIKKIVESMNGEVTVESEYHDGTSVTIVIDQKIGKDPSNIKQEVEDNEEMVFYNNKRVLVVDDDKMNLKVANRLLKNYKLEIDEVTNGFQCIEKIKMGSKYDIIFLDDWMPNMSGVETLRQLDSIQGFNTPVIALTANATSGMKEKYIKDGFNDFIAKPIERKELNRVIRKYLKNQ